MIRALFGGTFDPIHQGHLTTAAALVDELAIECLHLMPNAVPPHRPQPKATGEQRLAMVDQACQRYPALVAEDFELQQAGPSYTVATLAAFRQRYPNDSLVFVMGMDSLVSLDKWYQWQQLLDYGHIVALPRPGFVLSSASAQLQQYIEQHQCANPQQLKQRQHGCIWLAATPLVDISATALRHQLAVGEQPKELPDEVLEYIQQHRLYSTA